MAAIKIKKQFYTTLKNALTKTSDGFIGIQRVISGDNDYVYVVNGHIIVKMNYVFYREYMDKNHFPDLDAGKCICKRAKDYNSFWYDNDDAQFAEMYEKGLHETSPATLTKLSYDISENQKARLIVSGKNLVAIASHYYDAAYNFTGRGPVYASGRTAPVYMLNADLDSYWFGFMILPVNIKNANGMTLKEFIAA